MTVPQVVIFSYSEAAMFLRKPSNSVDAILSIHGQRDFGVECAVAHRLDLHFDDVDPVSAKDPIAAWRDERRRRWSESNGLREVPPTSAEVQAIIDFAIATRDVDGLVLFHCNAGISRSPAAAVICLAVWLGPGSERECVEQVLRTRRGAIPHFGIVGIADDLLSRGGRLKDALKTVYGKTCAAR